MQNAALTTVVACFSIDSLFLFRVSSPSRMRDQAQLRAPIVFMTIENRQIDTDIVYNQTAELHKMIIENVTLFLLQVAGSGSCYIL